MRIALFTETFLPNVDGVVNTLLRLLTYLNSHGHKTLLFAPAGGPRKFEKTRVIGLDGYPFFLYPQIKLVPPHLDLSEPLRRFKPDLVHVLHPMATGLAGLWNAKRLGIPVVASYHTDVSGYAAHYGFSFAKQFIWNYTRWTHNQADLTLCPSHATLEELQEGGFERLGIWSRGVDAKLFRPHRFVRRWKSRLTRGNPEDPLLLFVGRISHEKRIDRLRSLLDAIPQTRLAIVGDGPARPEMERLFAGTRTVFTGFMKGEKLARIYAAADVFVFPSANETFGNVVLEAMASGLPVVAAAAGGPLDFIQNGENGLLFHPDDTDRMISSVRLILEHPEIAERLSAAGRACARERSWDHVFEKLMEDYQHLVDLSPRPSDLRIRTGRFHGLLRGLAGAF